MIFVRNMSAAISSTATRAAPGKFVLAHPLDEFYAQMGLTLPPLQQVDGEAVPQPYKRLLVHQNDMTPTLENFHGRDIHLRLLGRRRKGNGYFREVVLLLDGTDQPVEFGAIKIHLDRFVPEVRRQILEERRPLGHVLQECGVKHSSLQGLFAAGVGPPHQSGAAIERRQRTLRPPQHPVRSARTAAGGDCGDSATRGRRRQTVTEVLLWKQLNEYRQ